MLHAIVLPLLIAAQPAPSAAPSIAAPECPSEPAKVLSTRGVKSSAIAYPDSAMVAVDVGSDGRMVQAKVLQSSHSKMVDLAVTQAAQGATYAPATTNCQPVPGKVVLYFTSLAAITGIAIQIPDHWCDGGAQRIEPVIVADLEIPRPVLVKANAGSRPLSSGVRVEIGADGKPVRTSAHIVESTGSDDIDAYAVASALSRSFVSDGPACKVANTEAFYIPAFVVAP